MAPWLLLPLLGLQITNGQYYTFNDAPAPRNMSLVAVYMYSIRDYTSDPGKDPSTITFANFKFHPEKNQNTDFPLDPAAYIGLQVSMLPWSKFFDVINPQDFCSPERDVLWPKFGKIKKKEKTIKEGQLLLLKKSGETAQSLGVHTYTIPPAYPAKRPPGMFEDGYTSQILLGGEHVLVLSNCGMLENATVSGDVIVRNSYGYLPSIECGKMSPFFGLFVLYAALAAIQTVLSVRRWQELNEIHMLIGVAPFLGVCESLLTCSFLYHWNLVGNASQVLYSAAICASVAKEDILFTSVFVVSQGLGVTTHLLDKKALLQTQGISCVYVVAATIQKLFLSVKFSHRLSILFTSLVSIPIFVVRVGIICLSLTLMSKQITTLMERNHVGGMVQGFSRLRIVLATAASVAFMCMMLVQYMQFYGINTSSVRLVDEFVPQIIYALVVIAMMYIVTPINTKYADFVELGDDAENGSCVDHADTVEVDDDVLRDEKDVSVVAASTIGASQGGVSVAPAE